MYYNQHDINLSFSVKGCNIEACVYVNDLNVFVPVSILTEAVIKKTGKRLNELTDTDVFNFIANNPIDFRGQQYPKGMDNVIAQAELFRSSKPPIKL